MLIRKDCYKSPYFSKRDVIPIFGNSETQLKNTITVILYTIYLFFRRPHRFGCTAYLDMIRVVNRYKHKAGVNLRWLRVNKYFLIFFKEKYYTLVNVQTRSKV